LTTINKGPSQVAYCECGAQFAGDNREELFTAAEQHLAHHHPQLLGALESDVVDQMSEARPGASNA
jgi:hypothetical protein